MAQSELSQMLADAAARDAAKEDRSRERILDAALAEAGAVGDRMTVEDVVRRSGLGRMTVYRRFPRRDDMLYALRARETDRFLLTVAEGMDAAENGREAVVEAFVAAVRFARTHPIMRRFADVDPGSVIVGVAGEDGALLAMGAAFVARHIHGSQPGEPTQAEMRAGDLLARLFVTYVAIPPKDPDPDSDAALREYGRTTILPIVERAAGVTPR